MADRTSAHALVPVLLARGAIPCVPFAGSPGSLGDEGSAGRSHLLLPRGRGRASSCGDRRRYDGTSSSAATVTVAPPPPPEVRRMGWFGLGARIGVTELRLTAPTSVVNDIQQITGGTAGVDQFALRSNVTTITPTLHLGGSGYFFKLDLPISFGSSFSMVGLGFYPINFGIYFAHLAMFPYLSLGTVANVVTSHATADPGTSNKLIGGIVQARLAAGVKFFPLHGLALSGELGYSPMDGGRRRAPARVELGLRRHPLRGRLRLGPRLQLRRRVALSGCPSEPPPAPPRRERRSAGPEELEVREEVRYECEKSNRSNRSPIAGLFVGTYGLTPFCDGVRQVVAAAPGDRRQLPVALDELQDRHVVGVLVRDAAAGAPAATRPSAGCGCRRRRSRPAGCSPSRSSRRPRRRSRGSPCPPRGRAAP